MGVDDDLNKVNVASTKYDIDIRIRMYSAGGFSENKKKRSVGGNCGINTRVGTAAGYMLVMA